MTATETHRPLTDGLVADGDDPAPPALSPDGRQVASALAGGGGVALGPADASTPPRRVADGGDPVWAPDSAALYVTADDATRLLRVSLTDLEAGPETLATMPGGIAAHRPLADGRTVALLAPDDPAESAETAAGTESDAKVWGRHLPPTRLRLLDLETRALRTVEGLGDRHVIAVAPRPDGGPLAVLSWSTPETDPGVVTAELHLVDPDTAAVQDLGPVGAEAESPAWWRRNGAWHLAHLSVTPPHLVGGLAVLDTVPPTSGPAGEHRNLTAGMTVCPAELVQVADGPPLALFADGLDTALYRLDPDTLRFDRLSTAPGLLSGLAADRSGDTVALLASTAYAPADIHAGPAGGPLVRLTDNRPDLHGIRWGTQERLSHKAADGLPLDGLLVLPPGRTRADGPFPLVTLVHGGPYFRSPDAFALTVVDCGQWLAAAGYAVFLPNPRGGSGHGHAFAALAAGAVGGDEWTDILGGIDLLIAEGVADPDRLGISGWSHGGYLAAWAVARSDRFKAAVMGAGISDWGMQAGTGDWGILDAALGGSTGWEGPGPHVHDRNSPISYAASIRTPVLILHGEEDTNVPLGQAIHFHRALRRFGVDHELVVYPREGHGLMERGHRLDALHRIRTWFDRLL